MAQPEIASRLGVPSFVARNISACARSYSAAELQKAEEDFVEAEEAVKNRTASGCAECGASDRKNTVLHGKSETFKSQP